MPDDSLKFAEFVKNIARFGFDLFANARAKVEAKEDYFRPSTYVREAIKRRTVRAKKGEQLLDLFDKYLRQRLTEGKKKEDTLRQDRKVLELFSEFVGVERSISAIEKTDVREWRNTIVSLPLAYKNRKAYENLDIRQAAGQARKNGDRGISLITANKYLSAVSALFIWARREGYVDANPCDGLFYDADKKNARPPFSAEQLNAIFQSPLFTGFAGPKAEHKPGRCKADDWRYWIPSICLFTGARLGLTSPLFFHPC